MRILPVSLLLFALLGSVPSTATAQEQGPETAPVRDDNPTGLPRGVKWTFNFDATWGTFGFANSLFQNPRGGVRADLSDQWFEGSVRPALSGSRAFGSASELYGKVSAAGERTYGGQPRVVSGDASSFQVDDLSLGWRSGQASESGDRVFDVVAGRAPFTIGHGLLISDGAAEGGSRGGYWTNARKAFQLAAIARAARTPQDRGFTSTTTICPRPKPAPCLWGANYEFKLDEHSTFAASYAWAVRRPRCPAGPRPGCTSSTCGRTAPVRSVPDVSFEFEMRVRSGTPRILRSHAWTLQGAYELSQVSWTPTLSYRYAFFQGDDPSTPRHEAFDPLLPAFHDWGTWWQGEIVGEYIAQNSNLRSHLIRSHVAPREAVEGGVMFYRFTLDQPASLAPRVTSADLAFEFDTYIDWKINARFTASFVGAFANPGAAIQQAFGRTQNFVYGMAFLSYSY
jgi:hypothetical protein